jgi:hypothetical protein
MMESYLMGTDQPTPARLRLRDLPLSARLVLSAFLISVGCGYFAALVQLHFQHASPGNAMPTRDDVVRVFYGPTGEKPKPKLQAVLEADEGLPFNGGGSMAPAFTKKSGGWESAVKKRAHKLAQRGTPTDEQFQQAEAELRKERETERLALVEWVAKGGDKQAYEEDSFCVSDALANLTKTLDEKFVGDQTPEGGRTVKVQTIITERCIRCHGPGGGKAEKFPLDSYEHIQKYLKVNESQAISKEALIQSTHVHLLSFSMLYALTGLIFAFTGLPRLVRIVIAPLPLVAQLVDIACWWLTRLDPRFADGIIIAGGVVGAGLGLHVVLGLFSLYGKAGRAVLAVLLIAAALGGWQAKERYIDPYLAAERAPAAAAEK